MVTDKPIWEAAMAAARSARRTGNAWIMWSFWAAGVALLLVELNAGMEYLEAGLQQNMGNVLGWAPALGMITLKVAEQSIWHWGTLGPAFTAVAVAALGLLLVAIGMVVNKQSENNRRA
jgi:hypothetical protein